MTSNLHPAARRAAEPQSRNRFFIATIILGIIITLGGNKMYSDIPVPEKMLFSKCDKPEFIVTHKIGINNQVDFNSDNLIFPNPSQSYISVINPILQSKSVNINIYDINSIKLYTTYLVAKRNELNLQLPTSLTNGVYFIEIIDKNENQLLLNDSFIISK